MINFVENTEAAGRWKTRTISINSKCSTRAGRNVNIPGTAVVYVWLRDIVWLAYLSQPPKDSLWNLFQKKEHTYEIDQEVREMAQVPCEISEHYENSGRII